MMSNNRESISYEEMMSEAELSSQLKSGTPPDRVRVRKTCKLYLGGTFTRSESGRSYPVTGPDGALMAHVPRASRKDVRDAVRAARAAFTGWAAATAYNRGQVIYRIAEMLDARRGQFTAELAAVGDEPGSVDPAVDRLVWYAGWADKYAQAVGGASRLDRRSRYRTAVCIHQLHAGLGGIAGSFIAPSRFAVGCIWVTADLA
jgi:acyl-CoA reductase-like NAD-dependent aldehyde dehydrogenase